MTRSTSDENKIADYVAALQGVLAPDRLAAYRPAGGDDLVMVSTYFWNAAISRDFHLALGAVEISMRNGIHAALAIHAGHDHWYDVIPLLPRERERIDKAQETVRKSGKAVIPGRVVAGVTFDFWTSMLSVGFGQNGYGRALWSPHNAALVKLASPTSPPRTTTDATPTTASTPSACCGTGPPTTSQSGRG